MDLFERSEYVRILTPENFHQELPIDIEWDLNTAPSGAIARPISSIEFDIPEGYIYNNNNTNFNALNCSYLLKQCSPIQDVYKKWENAGTLSRSNTHSAMGDIYGAYQDNTWQTLVE